MTNDNPILVEVHRGAQVESVHRGSALAIAADGRELLSIGAPSHTTYPRSALKLFQAIPLIESGAAARFNLSAAEIALACASHNAESFHTRAVADWLSRLGLSADDLECGAELPMKHSVALALTAAGEKPTRLHHNCSGKHSGMLTLACGLNVDTKNYCAHDHPTQRAWMTALSELIEMDVAALDWERDGCGLPAVCMPLETLARAFLRFADGDAAHAAAMQTILRAVREHPQMLAGGGRCCTDVIQQSGGRVVIKTGAEGVYAGVIPERGIGFALKIDDGAARAAMVALGALLAAVDAPLGDASALKKYFAPQIKNSQDKITGKILPSAVWKQVN